VIDLPAHAEAVDFRAIFKRVERPSIFAPGTTAKFLVVDCPACHRQHADFPASEILTCECGLTMCCHFGQPYIWRKQTEMLS
jgi:hypothetical protein